MSNNYKYSVVGKDQFAERLTKGFTGGNYSTDGNMVIGDKGDTDECSWVTLITFPTWMTDLVPSLLTSCCLTQDQAALITGTEASVKGASDGWYWSEFE